MMLRPSDLNYAAKIANPIFNAIPFQRSISDSSNLITDERGLAESMSPSDLNYNARMVQLQGPPILPQQPTFRIDPNQVINDIAMNAMWGRAPQTPMMNPFTMFSGQAPAFDWSGFFNSFGGK